jgi:hypothetical protein
MMGTMILYFFFLLKSNVFTFNEEGISISTHLLRPLLTHCESNDRVGVLSLLQNSVVEVVLYDCGTTEYTFTCVCVEGKCLKLLSFTHLRIDGGNIWCYNSPLDGKMS